MPADGELRILYGVEMPVESLDGQARSHVPNGQGAVRAPRDEKVRVGLEGEGVDGVCVRTVLLPLLEGVQIEELNSAITTGTEHEVPRVVELGPPDGSGVHICEGVRNTCAHEIPELDRFVSS